MAKTIYITESQLELIEDYLKEDVAGQPQKAEIPLQVNGNTTLQKAVQDKNKELKQAGVQLNKLEYTVQPSVANGNNTQNMVNAGKTYSKKQIEEMRIQKIMQEGTVYSKEDFTKKILKGNE